MDRKELIKKAEQTCDGLERLLKDRANATTDAEKAAADAAIQAEKDRIAALPAEEREMINHEMKLREYVMEFVIVGVKGVLSGNPDQAKLDELKKKIDALKKEMAEEKPDV